MPLEFPNRRTTYLPRGFSESSLWLFGLGHYEPLLAELRAMEKDSYERAGVDRALAIACDLARLEAPLRSRILDVGCSNGLVAQLLAQIGYQVTGIDNDIVVERQDWHDRERLVSLRAAASRGSCKLLTIDLSGFLESSGETFEAALLLSVLHHWVPSSGGDSGGPALERMLAKLCSRLSSWLYVETPIGDEQAEAPPDPAGIFLYPKYFVEAGLAADIQLVASTIATNGKPRRLYRIDLA